MSNGSEKSAAHGRLQKYFLLTSKEAYEAKAKNIQEKVYKEQEKEKRKLERIEKQKQKAVLQHQKQMKNKNNGKQQKINKPRAIHENTANSNQDCTNYQAQYGSPNDEKAEEEWLECIKCNAWYHESCAKLCGVLDDLYFTCQGCL